MSPIYSADVNIQCFLRMGFDHLVAHPEDLDEIFSNFKNDSLWKQYGEREIDNIKQWVAQNNIPILLSWSIDPTKVPCISVQIAQSTELVEAASMDDYVDYITEEILPTTVLDYFTPTNVVTGTTETVVTPPDTVDTLLVRKGQILIDSKDEQYLIDRTEGDNIIVVQDGDPINPTRVKIISSTQTVPRKRHQAAISESIDIGIHGHADQNTVLWMYYMVIWIMLRFKPELEKRCMDLSTFSASDFNRESQYLGENVFSRFIRVTARSMVTWLDPPETPIDTLVTNIITPSEDT